MLVTGTILPFPCKFKIPPLVPPIEQFDANEEDGIVAVIDAAECVDAAEGDCGLFWDEEMMDCCWELWWDVGMWTGNIPVVCNRLPPPPMPPQAPPTFVVWAFAADADTIAVGIFCDCEDGTSLCAYMDGSCGGGVVKVANCDGCDIVTPVMVFVANIELVEYMGWWARSICKIYTYVYGCLYVWACKNFYINVYTGIIWIKNMQSCIIYFLWNFM